MRGPGLQLDPRVKLLSAVGFIVAVATMPQVAPWRFGLFLVPVGSALFLFKVPPGRVLRKSLVVIPFILTVSCSIFVSTLLDHWGYRGGWGSNGFLVTWNAGIKAWLSSIIAILLGLAADFDDLVKGMRRLGVPRIMTLTLLFLYRYMSVLGLEIQRMKTAYDLRAGSGKGSFNLKTMGYLIGDLFIKAWERSERISQAMLARGFTGEMPGKDGLAMTLGDWGFLIISLMCILAIRLVAPGIVSR